MCVMHLLAVSVNSAQAANISTRDRSRTAGRADLWVLVTPSKEASATEARRADTGMVKTALLPCVQAIVKKRNLVSRIRKVNVIEEPTAAMPTKSLAIFLLSEEGPVVVDSPAEVRDARVAFRQARRDLALLFRRVSATEAIRVDSHMNKRMPTDRINELIRIQLAAITSLLNFTM